MYCDSASANALLWATHSTRGCSLGKGWLCKHDKAHVVASRRMLERTRLDADRVDGPIRPMKREPSQEWLTGGLRPGGGAPRSGPPTEPTVSLRPGGPAAAGAGAGARSSSASSLRFVCSPTPPACLPGCVPAQYRHWGRIVHLLQPCRLLPEQSVCLGRGIEGFCVQLTFCSSV
jgi:hypothetical protein